MAYSSTLSDRRALWAFILGVLAVTAGVLLHMPMFLMGRMNHFHLAGMKMDGGMLAGMEGDAGLNGQRRDCWRGAGGEQRQEAGDQQS